MQCQCGREATIHEVTITNGVRVERHLCEQCAQQQGLAAPTAAPINELLAKFVGAKVQGKIGPKPPTTGQCPQCGLTFAAFKSTELLGCPTCYEAFERPLAPLLERTHEGGTHHVGKVPRRALESSRLRGPEALERLLGGMAERQERLSALRKQLQAAVQAEQYERAAQLRDELRRVSALAPEIDDNPPEQGECSPIQPPERPD